MDMDQNVCGFMLVMFGFYKSGYGYVDMDIWIYGHMDIWIYGYGLRWLWLFV